MSVSASQTWAHIGEPVAVTATVKDPTDGDAVVAGCRVQVSLDAGTLLSISNGMRTTATTGYSYTDAGGQVEMSITRDTPGPVTVTVTAHIPTCDASTTSSATVHFYDSESYPVEILFCLDSTDSMRSGGEHSSVPSVKAFLQEMSGMYGIHFRTGVVRFNEPPGSSGADYILTTQERSLSAFTTLQSFIDWLDVGYGPFGGDFPELQLDALHYAAVDMDAHATSPHKYIVLITDNVYHYAGDGSGFTTLTKPGMISELTATGCPVYISVWDPGDAYQLETNDWYGGMTVNAGGFDPSKDGENNPTQPLYPLANLRARILSDLE